MFPDSDTQEPNTSISGKELTYPVAFRLPLDDYQKLKREAKKQKKTVSELLQEWVTGRLFEVSPEQLKLEELEE